MLGDVRNHLLTPFVLPSIKREGFAEHVHSVDTKLCEHMLLPFQFCCLLTRQSSNLLICAFCISC